MRFLCIDPAWEPGTPPDELLQQQGYGGVRFVVRPDLFDQVAHYINLGLHVALVLTPESGDWSQYASWGPFDFGNGPMLHWVVGNEMDGCPPSSWVLSADEFVPVWDSARCLAGERWIGGVCSGDVARAACYLQDDQTGLNIHLYGLSPEQATAKLAEYATLGVPIWIGEWHPAQGYSPGDYDFGDVWANDFCFSNAMVAHMGLFA